MNEGVCEKTGGTEFESGEKIVENNFRFVQKIQPAASAKHAGFDGGKRDESAAKNERYDEEDKIKRQDGR